MRPHNSSRALTKVLEAHACGVSLISNWMCPPDAMSACVRIVEESGFPFTFTLWMYGFFGAPEDVITSGFAAGRSTVTLSKNGLRRDVMGRRVSQRSSILTFQ